MPRPSSAIADTLVNAAAKLSAAADSVRFGKPVAYVYNPLGYAWPVHEAYLRRFGHGRRRVIFVGMNPGPFGMMQTGVPFGEIAAVRDWMELRGEVTAPPRSHPLRPVEGFGCSRSEVSGRRLWGLFAARFPSAAAFFTDHFVVNYCPLAFLDEGGRNLTPDKFAATTTARLFAACDEHLRRVIAALEPEWVIGVGDFAEKRVRIVLQGEALRAIRVGRILHPSPASPAANRDWSGTATRQLQEHRVWV